MIYDPDTIEHDEDEAPTKTLDEVVSPPPPIGHNSGNDVGGIAAERLKSFVERLERLDEEKKGIMDDMKDIFTEAKSTGFDVKIIRILLRLRKQAKEERQEQEELKYLYMRALGMDE